jgi:hypothetical protein
MRTVLIALLLLLSLPAQSTVPSRTELAAVEKSMDTRFKRLSLESPIDLLGLTRGVYLNGYGAVFTAEVNLLAAPGISPFRPSVSKEEVAQVKGIKTRRLPEFRALMQQLLLDSAGMMDRLPQDEQVVLAVTLLYQSWEDRAGLPATIHMQARRRALLDIATNRVPRSALATAIQTREE